MNIHYGQSSLIYDATKRSFESERSEGIGHHL